MHRLLPALALLAAGLIAQPAAALTYTLTSGSSLSADLSATFSVSVDTSTVDPSGPGSVSGSLSSTPTGTIETSTDVPPTTLMVNDADIAAPSPGTATGNAALNVLGIFTLNTAVNINVQEITLDLEAPSAASLTSTGPGQWSFTGLPSLLIGATASGSASASILGAPVNFSVPAFTFGGSPPGISVPIIGTLENLTGGGSELAFSGSGFDLMVPVTGESTTVNVDECIADGPFGSCLTRVHSVTLTIDSITFSNVNANIVATSPDAVIPEPATLALLGSAGLAIAGMRRRR